MRSSNSATAPALRTTDLLVLAVLGDGPQHGYGLAQEIAARTKGQVAIRAADLYRVLYRMDKAGLIEPSPAARRNAADERRAYYRITPLGRRVARAQATLLGEICAAVVARRPVTPERRREGSTENVMGALDRPVSPLLPPPIPTALRRRSVDAVSRAGQRTRDTRGAPGRPGPRSWRARRSCR